MTHRTVTCASLVLLSAIVGCERPDVFLAFEPVGAPQGAIVGTVSYTGPLPCTEGGEVVGAAVLLAFDTRLLPPPDGLGTSAVSLNIVTGRELFSGIRDRLSFNADGSLWCPTEDASDVSVGGTWSIAPLPAGTYQIRGFYDYDGDFDPGFSIFNLPTRGDVGGGAIENVAETLAGAYPLYRNIQLGEVQPDGSLQIPPEGAEVGGVAVSFGFPMPLERPIFYPSKVLDVYGTNTDPWNVQMPADYQIQEYSAFDTEATEKSFVRYVFSAGVSPEETAHALASPFEFPVSNPDPIFLYTRQDVNKDGVINSQDHVPDSELVPSLYPLSFFSKLRENSSLLAQASPSVFIQGVTLYKSLLNTVIAPADLSAVSQEILVAVRPSAICIDESDPMSPGALVLTHPTDASGTPIVADEEELIASVSAQFGGRPFELAYSCLPRGRYMMSLIYEAGQAWSLPNEAGICASSETPSADGTTCGNRPRLPSQAVVLTIGAPTDEEYCRANPLPTPCYSTSRR